MTCPFCFRSVYDGAASQIAVVREVDDSASQAELSPHRVGPRRAGGAARIPQLQDQEHLQRDRELKRKTINAADKSQKARARLRELGPRA